MNWFTYGYSDATGHRFTGAVPRLYEDEVERLVNNETPYRRLPDETPFIGHFPFRERWLVAAKISGTQDMDLRVVDEQDYAQFNYSPYRLVAKERPGGPIAEIGEGLRPASKPPWPAGAAAPYLPIAARVFESFAPSDRKAAHCSALPKGHSGSGMLFVIDQNADAVALPDFNGDEFDSSGGDASPALPNEFALSNLSNKVEALRRKVASLAQSQPTVREIRAFKVQLSQLEDRFRNVESRTLQSPSETPRPEVNAFNENIDGLRTEIGRLAKRVAAGEKPQPPPPTPWSVWIFGLGILLVSLAVGSFLYSRMLVLAENVDDVTANLAQGVADLSEKANAVSDSISAIDQRVQGLEEKAK